MSAQQSGEFLNVRGMAEALGVSPSQAYRLIADGKLPGTRVAGVIRVPRVAWQVWVDQQAEVALAGTRVETRSRS